MTTAEYCAWLNTPRADDPVVLADDGPDDEPATEEERREYEAAYAWPAQTQRDPDGARWMAMGWDGHAGVWR
jgi:hypothetical protein